MSKELMNTTEMKEVISKRTACMKVFEHADHRFTAAIYGTPVHYMKDGRWEEIDNRLEAAADEVPADADDMENISGAFRVRLSNKVKKKQMVSLGEGSRKLTWGFVDANSVKRQILKETEEQQPDSAGALEHTACLLYETTTFSVFYPCQYFQLSFSLLYKNPPTVSRASKFVYGHKQTALPYSTFFA